METWDFITSRISELGIFGFFEAYPSFLTVAIIVGTLLIASIIATIRHLMYAKSQKVKKKKLKKRKLGKCPKCKSPLGISTHWASGVSGTRRFLSCTNYPACTYEKDNYIEDEYTDEDHIPRPPRGIPRVCPNCNSRLMEIKNWGGFMGVRRLACVRFPKCRFSREI